MWIILIKLAYQTLKNTLLTRAQQVMAKISEVSANSSYMCAFLLGYSKNFVKDTHWIHEIF